METRCPECGKRLRLPENYDRQKIRCRNCGTIFRPDFSSRPDRSTSHGSQVSSPRDPSSANPFGSPQRGAIQPTLQANQPQRSASRPATRSSSWGSGGFGIGLVVLLLLIGRLPRLVDLLFERNQNPPPAPAKLDHDEMRALQDAMEKAKRRMEELPREIPDARAGHPVDGREETDSDREEETRALEVNSPATAEPPQSL